MSQSFCGGGVQEMYEGNLETLPTLFGLMRGDLDATP